LALTSDLNAYLPLTGGTLTGALNGTSASFSSSKSGSGVENVNFLQLRLFGTNAIGDSLDIRYLNSAGNNIANISAILGGDNVAYGSLAFSTRNFVTDTMVEAMRINNRGNVGIGTTTPNSKLEVAGNVAIGYTSAAPTNGMIVQGNVGIGTTNPFDDRLRVTASNTTGSDVYSYINATNEIDADFRIFISGSASSDKRALIGTSTNTSLSLITNNTERMRITSAGNVGIGTPSPATSAILDLSSTTGALLLPRMTTTQRDALTAVNGMILYNTTTNAIQGREGGAWVDLSFIIN
jgi:hypothetical protein